MRLPGGRTAVLYLVSVPLVATLGWFCSAELSQWQAGRVRRVELERFLSENLRGIAIGQPLPDIILWTADGGVAEIASELLPSGGIIAVVSPSCPTCIEAIGRMQLALDQPPDRPAHVIIVANQRPMAADLAGLMHDRGVTLPLYVDDRESLILDHGIMTVPTYIRVDSTGTVLAIATGLEGVEQIRQLIR